MIRVDLPEPDTPVMQVSRPDGMSRSTPLRLLPLAPRRCSVIFGFGLCRRAGISIARLPDRYWPVSERGASRMSCRVPWPTISPPCTPAPGPMSST
ncbi:hypothetical protein D9M72_597970 [compost metagenome]